MHSSLPTTMLVAAKVHVILRRYVVLTWMHDNRDFVVECDVLEEHKADIIKWRITGCDKKGVDITEVRVYLGIKLLLSLVHFIEPGT